MSDSDKPTAVDRPHKAASGDEGISSDVTLPDRPRAQVRDRPSAPPSRYLPGDEIARGGMGRVALATDTLLERVVAVKQALTLDPEMLRRFARETKITARLEHPSIVPVYDAGTDGDAPFYVMRRVSGRPLSELILASSTLDSRLALVPNVLAAAQAVAHAHARGIVHRDIKPANILVGDFGETVVIDWGLAKVVGDPDDDDPMEGSAGDSLRTRAGTVFGTPGFMSPGQLRGDPVGPAADVYALGASLYFVLAGRPPHLAKTGEAMMALAAEGPPDPLAKLAPGVPRELSTIVDTALAYGDASYRDASEFAEDLRRYTTGQLVASHHYSASERLIRFVRRNRAAVAIAMIAAVVIALGATLFIRRVVEERDRADAEARAAVAAQRSERERADQLLLLRAKTLLETNPTEALALLGDLAGDSPRLGEADAIANEAISRGVARALEAPPGPSTMVELDSTGTRLLQATVDGTVHVWDLVRETKIRTQKLTHGVRGTWVGSKIFLNGNVEPALFDPDTGDIEQLAMPRLRLVATSDDQQLVIGEGEDNSLLRIDLARRTATPVWPGHHVSGTTIAGDGSWFAAYNNSELAVFGRDNTELLRRSGDIGLARASRSKRLAILDHDQIFELDLATRTWLPVDTTKFHRLVVQLAYRGEELTIVTGSGHVLAKRGDRLVELARPPSVSFASIAGNDDYLFAIGNHSILHVSEFGVGTIQLPQETPYIRLAARRGHRRFAVVGAGVVLIYDLTAFSPVEVPAPPRSKAQFFDDTTLMMQDINSTEVWWRDLSTGRDVHVGPETMAIRRTFATDPATGTALMEVFLGPSSELYLVRKNSPEAKLVYDGPALTAFEMFSGGDPIYAVGGRVSIAVAGRTREVVAFAAPARSVLTLPDRRYFSLSTAGELARGNADGGAVERAHLEEPPRPSRSAGADLVPPTIDVAPDGSAFVGWGNQIWLWGPDRLERWAEAGSVILDIRIVRDHLVVMLLGNRVALIELATRKTYPLPIHGGHVLFSSAFDALVLEIGGYYHFVDPATRALWRTPIQHVMIPPDISSGGKQVVLRGIDKIFLWTAPIATVSLKDRVARHTNGVISKDGRLAWPWDR